MKILGFDSRKNSWFWEGLGFALLILTMVIVSVLKYFFHATETIKVLRSLGLIFTIVFVLGNIFVLYKQWYLFEKRRKKIAQMFRTQVNKIMPKNNKWEKIKNHFYSQNPAEWRIAIIDADAMLENTIRSLGYPGTSFGDMLKSINRQQAPWLDDAWHVHLLRNKLAHEGSAYHLSEREAYQAFRKYEQLFQYFNVI